MDWQTECKAMATEIRCRCIQMTWRGQSGHLGSMLSMAEIISVLYTRTLSVRPDQPDWPDRDRFILSKGHAGAAVCVALAQRGFFPAERLDGYYLDNGLSGHISHHLPGVELSTGSLGHGLPVAAGMAMAAKRQGRKHRVVCLMSDGDCNEGSTWEALLFAAQHRLDNLTVIVDYNRVQALGKMEDILEMEPFAEKLELCGWATGTLDGHDIQQLDGAFGGLPFEAGKPSWLIAHTTKGKGVKRLEDTVACHYGNLFESTEQMEAALLEVAGGGR